jgi:hypothetical protein
MIRHGQPSSRALPIRRTRTISSIAAHEQRPRTSSRWISPASGPLWTASLYLDDPLARRTE